ncbi:YifB family Mg chelatase-like AAA ATPase [Desertihabitans aurantiacus]|uniref:YifB family Mg chelatase-like AAA ATPase n=1 Tax=Desertihabitans aurantiacus TaxID=2282477 RepID=UPI000DF85AB2|nr:YifB family Mg chelatase-like AAA ATPase [Desertihabitans aurantiacus]
MSLAQTWSVALLGMDGQMVEVEAAIGGGLPRTVLVGLADTALYEARDRCRAAVSTSGFSWPSQLVTINLTPANLPKAGSHYDLSIVAAVLGAAEVVPRDALRDRVLLGELGLDGRVRRVRGVLPALLAARDAGFERVVVPHHQRAEAGLVEGLTVDSVGSLVELVDCLHGRPVLPPPQAVPDPVEQPATKDVCEVVGQPEAKWALEVAAAGRHHLFLQGPPGVGKTMLAERLPGLLPELTLSEALEVSAIHSLAGHGVDGLITRPPFADPHHSASLPSVVGGGARMARPGAISLAHRGVLFIDEAPEFPSKVLEGLRTPLESGRVTLGRAEVQASYPARFQLVLAANPCPCGQAATPGAECTCTPMAVRRYAERISGPILDRVDISTTLAPLRRAYLRGGVEPGEPTAVVGARVLEARERQRRRLAGTGWSTNAEVVGHHLRRVLPLPEGVEALDQALQRGRISARGVDKVLRISWTLADLAQASRPARSHLLAALAMRRGEQLEGRAP